MKSASEDGNGIFSIASSEGGAIVLVKPTPAWIGVGALTPSALVARIISPDKSQSSIFAVPSVPLTYQRGNFV